MSSTDATALPIVTGFSTIAKHYDVALCDVWGVVHNGLRASAPACDALTRFREAGGTVVLITNAPRPAAVIATHIEQLGGPRSIYDAIVSSGDVTRTLIAEQGAPNLHHIGPDRDLSLFEGLAIERVTLDDAAFIVCTGLIDDETETAETYQPLLERALARDLLLICANPDLVVERGHRLLPCAGAIADLYGQMGGRTIYAGKPHRPIYDIALARAETIRGETVPIGRVIGIGDAARTDLAGAARFGIDGLFVTAGIHGKDLNDAAGAIDEARLATFLAAQQARPAAIMPWLSW